MIEVTLTEPKTLEIEVSESPEAEIQVGEIVYINTGIPIVTKEDDGKVLQVEDGKWVKKHLPPYDEGLSQLSSNAVQNKAVAAKFVEVETTIGNIDVLLGTI